MQCEVVKGLCIMTENGMRVLGLPLLVTEDVKGIEKKIHAKAKENEGPIVLCGEYIAVCKKLEDICIILYAQIEENEIVLASALDAFYSAVVKRIKGPLTQKSLNKHYDEVFLLLDAFIYKGLILTDSTEELCESVPKRTFESLNAVQMQSKLSSVLRSAQKSFASSWFGKQ